MQTTYSAGQWNTLCSEVSVERHTACEGACRVREEQCDKQTQFYDSFGCQCKCKNQVRERERTSRRHIKTLSIS